MQISKAVDAGKLAEARLPELLQIHDLGKDLQPERYGVKGLPSGLRRRTRSHNSYRHAKRPRAATQVSGFNEPKMMNRKMRRSKQFREYQGNPFEACASASTSTDSKKVFLPTHVFQAKRMTTRELFGRFVLPEGLPGKGHGTRSFMHKLDTGCVLHDMSYWCSIEVVLGNWVQAVYDAVQGLVERCAVSRRPLMRSPTWATGDSLAASPDGGSIATLWAHCAYARDVMAEMRKMREVVGLREGRLGRIELRGPRSRRVLEEAVASMKGQCPAYEAFDAEEAGECQGCTVVGERATYASLFKAICLTGGVLLCGQREWHWYSTMRGLRFYPDDYYCYDRYELEVGDGVSMPEFKQGSDVPVRVWVRNKGVLEAGMELVDGAGDVVGLITSAKPRMIPNKYGSIGVARDVLFETKSGDSVKRRLVARSRTSPGSIDVTVRPL